MRGKNTAFISKLLIQGRAKCISPNRPFAIAHSRRSNTTVNPTETESVSVEQADFIQEYKTRTRLESIIYHYAAQPLPQFSLSSLYDQSTLLNEITLLENAQSTVNELLVFNSRRLQQFRTLPYLVVLNPSISESYSMYLKSMSLLIHASLNLPKNLDENKKFSELVLAEFIKIHMDSLPLLSKGFQEVSGFLGHKQIKEFLNEHLVERIRMRLIAHQHIQLTKAITEDKFVEGGKFNGVLKEINISDIIRQNAEHVNGLFFIKYDQTVPIIIDTNLEKNKGFWSNNTKEEVKEVNPSDVVFPYIDLHLDYILSELFKNAFRAHIENNITEPVRVTISVSRPSENTSYLEIRIRDQGKGISKAIQDSMFDYSFSTYDSGEGDSYKTLNVPPGLGGNTVAGMGYGLPLLKNYIEVFNDTQKKGETKGLLSVQTYLGWGTDVYLKVVGK